MADFVTEQMLCYIKKNGIYPQDIQHTKTIWLTFGTISLSVSRAYTRKTKVKHVNGWQTMSADEINQKLKETEWLDVD